MVKTEDLLKDIKKQLVEITAKINELSDDSQTFDTEELSDEIADEICGYGLDLINDYELSMSGREVELDSVDFSKSTVENIVHDILTKKLKK